MKIFDAHIHNKCAESGGFLIALEGSPSFSGTLNNIEILRLHDPRNNYFSFYYVTKKCCKEKFLHRYLKYHPRREKYSVDEVIESIALNNPRCVMVDTLNEPYWQAYDYWRIARTFPGLIFIFPHAGGYLINDFIKICHFQKNVWLDFALTHTVLARYGDSRTKLPYIEDAINYALNGVFNNRILLSSDFPFFSQKDVFDYYEKKESVSLLNHNFKQLIDLIK